jgi:hypothetical protein
MFYILLYFIYFIISFILIISRISYFICLHYLDKKTEEEINLI